MLIVFNYCNFCNYFDHFIIFNCTRWSESIGSRLVDPVTPPSVSSPEESGSAPSGPAARVQHAQAPAASWWLGPGGRASPAELSAAYAGPRVSAAGAPAAGPGACAPAGLSARRPQARRGPGDDPATRSVHSSGSRFEPCPGRRPGGAAQDRAGSKRPGRRVSGLGGPDFNLRRASPMSRAARCHSPPSRDAPPPSSSEAGC